MIKRLALAVLLAAVMVLPAAYFPGSPQPNPNLLINPWMDIDQVNESASISVPTSSGGSAGFSIDGWDTFFRTNATGITAQRVAPTACSATVPGGFPYAQKITIGTGAAALGAEQSEIRQYLEGSQITDTGLGTSAARTLSLQVWLCTSQSATESGYLANGYASTRFYPLPGCSLASTTWTLCQWIIPGDTTGSWTLSGTGTALYISLFTGCAGSATAGAWSGSAYCISTQTNLDATTGAALYVGPIKLEVSPVPTPFARRNPAIDLAIAQRRYAKSYSQGTAPGTTVETNFELFDAGDTNGFLTFELPQTMRCAPTMTIYSGSTGASGKMRDRTANADVAASLSGGTPDKRLFVYPTGGATVGHAYGWQWTADCRL